MRRHTECRWISGVLAVYLQKCVFIVRCFVANVKSINWFWFFGKLIIPWTWHHIRRLLGTPSVVEWPDIANCLYYQTNFPNFPLNGVELSHLPMSNPCRQLLAVRNNLTEAPFFIEMAFLSRILLYTIHNVDRQQSIFSKIIDISLTNLLLVGRNLYDWLSIEQSDYKLKIWNI